MHDLEKMVRELAAKWRKMAEDSRQKLETTQDPELATQLETNWRDLEMCADELDRIKSSA